MKKTILTILLCGVMVLGLTGCNKSDGKDVTLWDEFPEHRAVSQKDSFQFWTEDISFFTIALYGLPNIPLPIPQEQP